MAAKKAARKVAGVRRDVTHILTLVRKLRHGLTTLPITEQDALCEEIDQLLVDMDARTGKKDPTKRHKR